MSKIIMKTIEQHLQDLFVGKTLSIYINQGQKTTITSGVCSSINQVHTNENGKDIWAVVLDNQKVELYADLETDLIEILK